MITNLTKIRVSAPTALSPTFSALDVFPKWNWLFESHQGIIDSFRPDVAIYYTGALASFQGRNGVYFPVRRRLVAQKSAHDSWHKKTLAELRDNIFVTTFPSDEKLTYLTRGDTERYEVEPDQVFPVHDISGARMAVEMGLGYSAMPEVIVESLCETSEYITLFPDWRVSDAYMVCLFDDLTISFGDLSPLLLSLEVYTFSNWAALASGSNILTFPSANV
jgi:DNA-binding transcriptional LysR family regulator